MSDGKAAALQMRLKDLRKSFDSSFALPLDVRKIERGASALCCQAGGNRYALPVIDLAGLFPLREVFAIPARSQGFLGISFFRSSMVPVYEMAAFLNLPPNSGHGWCVLLGRGESVGLRVDAVDGYASFVGSAAVNEQREELMPYVKGVVERHGVGYGLIDAEKLHKEITRSEVAGG